MHEGRRAGGTPLPPPDAGEEGGLVREICMLPAAARRRQVGRGRSQRGCLHLRTSETAESTSSPSRGHAGATGEFESEVLSGAGHHVTEGREGASYAGWEERKAAYVWGPRPHAGAEGEALVVRGCGGRW